MDAFTGLFILCAACAIYFLPTIVASGRRHRNGGAIFIINLFFGWTLLGWVLALAWANTANVKGAA